MKKPVPDTFQRGDLYERYVGRWSRQVAPKFLSWLGLPAGRKWLDVGCGTGALSGAIIDHCSPRSVVGIEPSPGFLSTARHNLGDRMAPVRSTAVHIPLANACVDVTVSGLVLNFIPDPPAALLEMSRVTRPGGTVAAYVWDYGEKMEFMRIFWEAAAELDPYAAELDEGRRFPLCTPEGLTELFSQAGLDGIQVEAVDIPTPVGRFGDYSEPLLGGQGAAPRLVRTLDEVAVERLGERLRERTPVKEDGTISLIARAWAVRARVPD